MSNNEKILIAPNSFKECADSVTIAEQIRDNLVELDNTELITKPISDGGDGFLNVCKFYFPGEIREYEVSSAYNESKILCPILYRFKKKDIYIESANVLGLKIVPLVYRNPLKISSKGLGELLIQIEKDVQAGTIEVEKVYIGVGGTATIDMGLGMMSELGLRLLRSNGEQLSVIPDNFILTQSIDYQPVNLSFNLIPIVDVTNSLLGRNNGIRVYGKQKGATDDVLSILEKSFDHMVNLFNKKGLEISFNKLSGAGGGLPTSFQIFYQSRLIHSSEFIKYHLGLSRYSNSVQYLITGEGAYDSQNTFGKGVSTLIDIFSSNVKKIFLICGKMDIDGSTILPGYITPLELNQYFENQRDSIIKYEEGLSKACIQIKKKLYF